MELIRLPKQINAVRAVTYAVTDEMLEDIVEIVGLTSKEEVTAEHLVEHVEDWAVEDLSSVHTKTVFQDEWGNTLKEWN